MAAKRPDERWLGALLRGRLAPLMQLASRQKGQKLAT